MYKYGKAKCKCHGVSGSCNVRTCWHQLPTLDEVGDRLKERYDGASLVKFNRQGTALVAADRRFRRPTSEDLVFFEPSPNYCEVSLSSLSLQSSAVEQVLDILVDILFWEIAEVVSPCLPRGL